MRALAAAACGALLAGLAGCGGVDLSSARGVRPGTAGELQKDVLAVTQAAAVKNWPATRTAIASLRATLAASRSAGTISTQRADEIDAAVRAVLADLPAVSTPTPSPSTTAAPVARTTTRAPARAPVPTPVTGKGDKGPGKGKHDH
ncbi:MAG: hypothetical protein QOE97_2415 [Pseudonocardiales bacterium]|nr:hypothetical protein [Pseudonocardiales bacterium]